MAPGKKNARSKKKKVNVARKLTRKPSAPKRGVKKATKKPARKGAKKAFATKKPVRKKAAPAKRASAKRVGKKAAAVTKGPPKKRTTAKTSSTKTGKTPKARAVAIKALGGHVVEIVLDEDCVADERRDDIDRAVANFVALEPAAVRAAEEHLFRYYEDCRDYFAPGEPGYVDIASPTDIWRHIELGGEATVSRQDNAVYISLGCNCDWEPEHGLQIVLKDGSRVNKVGPYDGHVTNAHAYADASLENVVYRARRATSCVP
jgi:hypothetical protein